MAVSITLAINQNSQNIANNTSNITVKVTAKWTGGSYNATGQCTGSITIDGTKYSYSGITFNENRTTTGSKVIMTKTVNVTHNSNGAKTVSCSASFVTGVSSGTVGASGSKTLTTIARKSTLSASNGTLGTYQTLTITKKYSSSVCTITFKCGSRTGTIATKTSGTSINWRPPVDLASQYTTSKSVNITFTITTYTSSTGSSIGSNSLQISCKIPEGPVTIDGVEYRFKPSCTINVSDPTGYAYEYGGFLKNLSKFKIDITPILAFDSPISSYSTTVNGSKYTTASFTTDVLKIWGRETIYTTVKDKRGYFDTIKKEISILDYSEPKITKLAVHRCDSTGVENDQGGYIRVDFGGTVTALDNKNTATYRIGFKKTGTSGWLEIPLTEYENNYNFSNGVYIFEAETGSSYDIRLSITDNFNTEKRTTSASTAFTLMHWLASGLGMAIGKVAELANVLDIGLQTRFLGGILHPVLEPETDLDDIRTPNTYVGANVSTYNYQNCPISSGTFTLEVVGAGSEGQVKQSIQVCSKAQSKTYERYYYTGAWGDWVCVSDYDGALLWEGGYYMTADHTIDLPEAISKQRAGIVLVFSEYVDGVAKNQTFHTRFIPKMVVSKHSSNDDYWECIQLSTSNLAFFATKYLHISDTQIRGHTNNNQTMQGDCGITCTNNRFVLRYVIGV